jgi:hypothetical protein
MVRCRAEPGLWERKILSSKDIHEGISGPVILQPEWCQCHWYPVIINVRGRTSNTEYLILGLTAEDNMWALESDFCLTAFVQMSLSVLIA